ncbi:MAG: hypothetical protein RQ856_00855 [Candidatus Izemoplasmatales bacterium]|nr:hypothetical protein [Candidatus Izemoplasmatales bacterium]
MTQEMELNLPHVPIKKNIIIFIAFLIILLIATVFLYGFCVLVVVAIAIVSGGLVEFIFAKVRKLEFDLS